MHTYIGITCDLEDDPSKGDKVSFIKNSYFDAISDSGGIPLLLPSITSDQTTLLVENICHGLLITGGDFDIPAQKYGENPLDVVEKIIPERTEAESILLRTAIDRDMPILGICGGHQLINVLLGGTLYQDIGQQCPNAINHSPGIKSFTHSVTIEPSSELHKILGVDRVNVNSTHHQALKDIAEGYVVSARSADGIVEGIERQGNGFVLGVQWHPEAIRKINPVFDKLFNRFIDEARLYAEKK